MAGRSRLFLVVAGVIVALVLAAGAGAGYLFSERAESREELAQVHADQDLLRGDVEAMSKRKRLKADELALKEEELLLGNEELKVEELAPHPALATLAEARDFSGRLVSYAAAQDLTIGSFEQAQKTASVGAVDYPAFGYTLAVQGPPEPVIDMLDILHEIGGSRIEALELTRSVEDDSPWDMSLSISVIYATGGLTRLAACPRLVGVRPVLSAALGSCRRVLRKKGGQPLFDTWYWSLGIVIFGIGASVGSFLNVVADRVPDGRSLVAPRSFCDSCKRTIPSRELFPVFSYILLGGKCRECGAPIPLRVLGVELVSGLLFLAIFLKFGLTLESLVLAFAVSLLTVVAVIDLEHGLILNKIVLPSIVMLLLLAPFWSYLGPARTFLGYTGMLGSLSNSLAAGLVAFLLLLAIFLISPAGMGFGDVKFAPAIGLMVGFPEVMMALWLAFVTGGVVAIFLMVLRKKGRKDAIPFGEFLSLGGILVLLAGSELMSTYNRMMDSIVGLYL